MCCSLAPCIRIERHARAPRQHVDLLVPPVLFACCGQQDAREQQQKSVYCISSCVPVEHTQLLLCSVLYEYIITTRNECTRIVEKRRSAAVYS